jgi:chromosome partitioning protein
MAVIAVANLKGGVGKSTIAVNVACELAARHRVILLDADAQGSATHWCNQGQLPIAHEHAPLDNARDAARWIQAVLRHQGEADYVVIDCPPHIGAATEAAVGVADLVLVPATPSGVDLVAAIAALDLIRRAREARQDAGPRCLLVPSRVDRRTSSGREIETALRQFGEPITPCVCQRAALVDSFSAGQWIGQYAADSPAHQEIAALARAVARAARVRPVGTPGPAPAPPPGPGTPPTRPLRKWGGAGPMINVSKSRAL